MEIPEDIRRGEEEAEHHQLEGEALVEARRDRDMFGRDEIDARAVMYDDDPYAAWGDYELDLWESTPGVETCFEDFEAVMAEGDESLGRDEQSEESGIGVTIPEYLDWEYMEVTG